MRISDFIKESAKAIGFDACGIAQATHLEEDARVLKKWLSNGHQAEMHYLERNFEKRTDPTKLCEGAKSVVVLLMNYKSNEKHSKSVPRFAKYSLLEVDYHKVIKKKLKALERTIAEKYGNGLFNPHHQHAFVDSAPILERRWGERAGLGWIGKNKMLINPQLGSYFFIAILLINTEMEYDTPIENRCGQCTKCLRACPPKALTTDGLDARKCTSYQTIEKKDHIDEKAQKKLAGYCFGCDICNDVCPYNKNTETLPYHEEFTLNREMLHLSSECWERLSKEEFANIFKHSAVKRAGYQKLMQNISYATQK